MHFRGWQGFISCEQTHLISNTLQTPALALRRIFPSAPDEAERRSSACRESSTHARTHSGCLGLRVPRRAAGRKHVAQPEPRRTRTPPRGGIFRTETSPPTHFLLLAQPPSCDSQALRRFTLLTLLRHVEVVFFFLRFFRR